MNDQIIVSRNQIFDVLGKYHPKISHTRSFEIAEKIYSAGKVYSDELIVVSPYEIDKILYEYYPSISHKTADRIIKSMKIISENNLEGEKYNAK